MSMMIFLRSSLKALSLMSVASVAQAQIGKGQLDKGFHQKIQPPYEIGEAFKAKDEYSIRIGFLFTDQPMGNQQNIVFLGEKEPNQVAPLSAYDCAKEQLAAAREIFADKTIKAMMKRNEVRRVNVVVEVGAVASSSAENKCQPGPIISRNRFVLKPCLRMEASGGPLKTTCRTVDKDQVRAIAGELQAPEEKVRESMEVLRNGAAKLLEGMRE